MCINLKKVEMRHAKRIEFVSVSCIELIEFIIDFLLLLPYKKETTSPLPREDALHLIDFSKVRPYIVSVRFNIIILTDYILACRCNNVANRLVINKVTSTNR